MNLPVFLTMLSNELADCGKSEVARVAAGLQLKNYLTSKDPERKYQLQQAWLGFEQPVRQHVKGMVLQTLGTEPRGHRAAAQCVAYIGSAEIPCNQWPDLIPALLYNVTNPQSTESVKEASLEAIGYICEEIDPRHLATYANEILTAIVQGMRKEEPSNLVRLAATKAMLNSLEFTKANFEKESERHFIMQVVCEATQCNVVEVQVVALQNLVKIMSLYYQYMEAYMGPALFAITLEAMKSNVDAIGLQGIEFWSTVCDEEQDLAIEVQEAMEAGRSPEQTSKFYVKGALQYLAPVLLQRLMMQDECDDEDDWNPSKAAGVCLSLMSVCCENDIVPFTMPFIKQHIVSADWKAREAAVMALGSILEGPDPSCLVSDVSQVMETLISIMHDETVQVRDSAAWTIGRVCECVPLAVLNAQFLMPLLQALVEALQEEPRVATNVCWAFSSLGEAAHDNAPMSDDEDDPSTYCLSMSFEVIVSKLIETTDRQDAGNSNLRSAAYEALMDLIKYSAKDCYPVVQKTTLHMMGKLQQVLQLDVGAADGAIRQQVADLESLLCATLQSLIRKVTSQDALSIADTVMTALLMMFTSASGQIGGVQEDAIMTVSVLVEAIKGEFVKYMDAFGPYLKMTLKNFSDHQVCIAAIGLVGDICRALQIKVLPYCDDIMQILLEILSNNAVHRSVKPHILSAIGDVALSIGPHFKKYLDIVLKILMQASQLQVDKTDFDMLDYLNELREGCLEAYTGIVQGLKGEEGQPVNSDVKLLWPHTQYIVNFIDFVCKDGDHTESIVACCSGLIGDLCTAFGKSMTQVLHGKPAIIKMIHEGKHSRNKRAKTLAVWALKELKKLES